MKQVEEGSTVTLSFKGKLRNGQVFGEATADKPVRFTVGKSEMLKGVEEALIGMSPGQSKTAVIPPEKGFGSRAEESFVELPRSTMPENFNAKVDDRVNLTDEDGTSVPARVVEITQSEVIFDTNHPLAGEDLTLDLKVLGVE